MEIKILGSGCSKCTKVEKNVKEAVEKLNIEAKITFVEDLPGIMKYGVMVTPALVINEKVKSKGSVLSTKEIIKFIQEEM